MTMHPSLKQFGYLFVFAFQALLLVSCTDWANRDSEARLFFDDFNRSDEALSASTDWTSQPLGTSSLNIVSKRLKPTGGLGTTSNFPRAYYSQTLSSGVSSSIKITAEGGAYNGEVALVLSPSSKDVYSSTSYWCGLHLGVLKIHQDASQKAAGSTIIFGSAGTSGTLTMTVSDGTVTCSFSGTSSDSVSYVDTNSPFSGGYFGLFSNSTDSNNFLFIDDFTVR